MKIRTMLSPAPAPTVAIVLALALVAGGCDRGDDLETRTFRLNHLDAGDAIELISPYVYSEREGAPGKASVTRNAITVREERANLDRIAEVLDEFDRPEPTVLLRFQLIEADGFEQTDPAIAEVEEQLRKLFRFEGYRLVADAVLRGTERELVSQYLGPASRPAVGGGGASAGRRATSEDDEPIYEVLAHIDRVRGAVDAPTVHLQVELEMWGADLLNTSVNVRSGQTIVLGTARPRGDRGALVLTVTPEIGSGGGS